MACLVTICISMRQMVTGLVLEASVELLMPLRGRATELPGQAALGSLCVWASEIL